MELTILFTFLSLYFTTQTVEPMPASESRTIVLIRHAKSSWDDPTLRDFDRPLNDRGYSDAPFMGKQLAMHGLHFDRVIASPSKRTTQTLQYVSKEAGIRESIITWDSTVFHSTAENLLRLLENLDPSVHTVAVVGHNPSMTQLANLLQSDTLIDNVPTCGMVAVNYQLSSWSELRNSKGKLDFYIYPKLFKNR